MEWHQGAEAAFSRVDGARLPFVLNEDDVRRRAETRVIHSDTTGRNADIPVHGQLLRVRGRLHCYQGHMQVTVEHWERVTDANEELLHWMDAMTWAASRSSVS